MTENTDPVIALAIFLAISGYLCACFVVDACKKSPHGMNRSVLIGGLVLLAVCLWQAVVLYSTRAPIYLLLPIAPLVTYGSTAFFVTRLTRREIARDFQLSKQVSAESSALMQLLDADGDGIISHCDLSNAFEHALSQGVPEDVLDHLTECFVDIGHLVDDGVLITLSDLTGYHQRFKTKYGAWFLPAQ